MTEPSADTNLRLRLRPALLIGLTALVLGACAPAVRVRGNLPDNEVVAKVSPGVHSREDIVSLLGSPSAVSTFQDDKWYYIGQKTTQFAFFAPDVLERRVLVVSFDDGGTVAGTETYALEDGRDIDPVARTTPTEGRDLTIMQQLFGNLGRFSTDSQREE